MLNFAHRGFKSKYPENTMLAFKEAIRANCDGIEFDLHLTKDGEVIIIHDETLIRTTGIEGYVRDFTLSEIKKLNAAFGYDEFYEEIPTLREYLELVKDSNIITNMELKTGIYTYPGIEEKVYNILKEYDYIDRTIISSFNHESVLRMKAIDENIITAFLEESLLIKPWEYLKEYGINYYHPLIQTVSKELVDRCHENNIKVNPWYGKEKYDFKKAIEFGIDGIITDYPDIIDKLKK